MSVVVAIVLCMVCGLIVSAFWTWFDDKIKGAK